MLLFWRGATISSASLSLITSYYFFLMIGGSLLISHSEENIGLIDIQEGRLATYLLKPFGYFINKWLEELPYRLLQGIFGITAVLLFVFLFHIKLTLFLINSINVVLLVLIVLAAITLAQVYKVCLGFICFWTTDLYGIFQFSDMLMLIFAGLLIPVSFYPTTIALISYVLPFAYIVYFPVAAFAGFFTTSQLLLIFLGQLAWILIFTFVYRLLWKNGVKLFTGVGQ